MFKKSTLEATFLDYLALRFCDAIGELLPEWVCLLTSKLADIPVSRVRKLELQTNCYKVLPIPFLINRDNMNFTGICKIYPLKRKRKRFNSVLWKKPLHPQTNPKSNGTKQKHQLQLHNGERRWSSGSALGLACGARGPGFDSRSCHLNFKDWLSPASKSRYG